MVTGARYQRPEQCALCGGAEFRPTEYRNLYGTGANLQECAGCGFRQYDKKLADSAAWHDSAASRKLFDDSYPCGSMCNRDPAKTEMFHAYHRSYYTGIATRLRELAGEPCRRLIESGSGYGEFAGIAQETGWEVRGCDPNLRGCELAREKYGVQVDYGVLLAVLPALPPGPWDAGAMLDVIEHTDTPREDLEAMAGLLRPGAALVVQTFYDEWHDGKGLAPTEPDGWWKPHGFFDPYGHVNHFTTPVLLRLLEETGFSVESEKRSENSGIILVYARRRP